MNDEILEISEKIYFSGYAQACMDLKNKWIAVTDRLPSTDGKYLVLVQNRHRICVFYQGHFYKARTPKFYYKYWLTEDKRYKVVTHWMKLPDLPL